VTAATPTLAATHPPAAPSAAVALAVTTTVQPHATSENPTEWRQVLLLDRHAGPVNSATFSPDGKWIVTSGSDHTARVWDAATGKQVIVLRDPDHTEARAVYSPDGMLLVTTGTHIRIWQVGSWQSVDMQGTQLGGIGYRAAFSLDGTRLATSAFQDMSLWSVGTWEWTLQLENPVYINDIAFSPDGTQIVTALWDNTARVWDLKTGDTLAVLRGHTSSLVDAEYSPNGRLIVTAGDNDKTARIWDVATEQTLLVLSGHTGSVYTAVFSPDGKQVLTASGDDTAQLWDAQTGATVATVHSPDLLSATFNFDGTRMITTGGDGTARVWSRTTQ
jgi:WD40 repeat protein